MDFSISATHRHKNAQCRFWCDRTTHCSARIHDVIAGRVEMNGFFRHKIVRLQRVWISLITDCFAGCVPPRKLFFHHRGNPLLCIKEIFFQHFDENKTHALDLWVALGDSFHNKLRTENIDVDVVFKQQLTISGCVTLLVITKCF